MTPEIVREILTSAPVHPRGIKVRLELGQVVLEEKDYMITKRFELMQKVLVRVVRSLLAKEIVPFLSGSFAICVYAGEVLGDPQDIDFLFRSRDEHDRAVLMFEEELGFIRTKQASWASEGGDESINTKFESPEGIQFDVAYTIGDIALSLDPTRVITLLEQPVPILSLQDMRKSYQRFFDEKPGAAIKIGFIDELLKREIARDS